ncbi:MAG: TonB family protein [Fibrobacteres bacterium]|nr:TonB family protein [Fibrobacterota bacterium]
MRIGNVIEKSVLFAAAVAVNLGLYLLVPYIQVLIAKNAVPPKHEKLVTTVLEFTPPTADKLVKREIKEIKTASVNPPQPTPTRPTTPGGGLKIDLSPAGGEGLALQSGGDRTGGIGAGTGGGKGDGMSAMTYEVGQTDIDATPMNDPPLDIPSRASREGVGGYVDLVFIVNEAGLIEQISVLKEEPTGYGFANSAIASAKKIRFKPAVFQKLSVRQRVKKRYSFEMGE